MLNIKDIKNICVLGVAESGLGAALLAMQQNKNVFVSDLKSIKPIIKHELIKNKIVFEENGHTIDKILTYDLIIKSPGISEKAEVIKRIRSKNILLISEIDFAFYYKGNSKVIAITGSNGKSTTTSLIYHIFKTANLNVDIVGNIGYAFSRSIYDKPKKYYVVEVSSFQLDDIYFFKPDIAILLNISPDHLDRYQYEFKNYIDAKFNISTYQDANDYFIYCVDDEVLVKALHYKNIKAKKLQFSMDKKLLSGDGAYMDKNIQMEFEGEHYGLDCELPLKGKHNIYNMMAATTVANVFKINKSTIKEALQTFKGLEHRLEFVCTIRGVDYINDSKATNLNSTWYALESVDKKCVLILGGIDKGNDYSQIEELVKTKVKAIVCLGKDNSKIINYFKNILPVYDCNSLEATLSKCYDIAEANEVVLLSPACASFDLFYNYEERGQQFKETVKKL